MLLKQLNYFATVAELGSFTEAAYTLGISQSAVSQQIKALEEDLSVQLIIRNNRTFTLTRAESIWPCGRGSSSRKPRPCGVKPFVYPTAKNA